jgi:hypothetical protein
MQLEQFQNDDAQKKEVCGTLAKICSIGCNRNNQMVGMKDNNNKANCKYKKQKLGPTNKFFNCLTKHNSKFKIVSTDQLKTNSTRSQQHDSYGGGW